MIPTLELFEVRILKEFQLGLLIELIKKLYGRVNNRKKNIMIVLNN